jgi:hypothetical protein
LTTYTTAVARGDRAAEYLFVGVRSVNVHAATLYKAVALAVGRSGSTIERLVTDAYIPRFSRALSGEERKTAERERLHLRRALLYQDTTIHHQAGAGDVTSVFGCKEDSGAGQILRGT